MVTAAQLAGMTIEAGAVAPVHALNELRLHLGRLGPASADAGRLRLSAEQRSGDGFHATVARGDVTLVGESPRGLINAVAWLLERLGFGWPEPGEAEACFNVGMALEPGEYRETPAFARRTLVLGQDALHDQWRDWLPWASRNRMNSVFFHDTPPSRVRPPGTRPPATAEERASDRGGWLFELWDREGAEIRAAAAERSMSLQFGGHHLPTLLSRDHFAGHPEWFPERGGAREARFNLCTASPEALAALGEAAEAFVARFAGADVYHFWADDIRGGGWCECARCSGRSASDQALRATNAVAAALEGSGVRVAHLAYHDTLEPPSATRPRENVTLLFAPRERDYSVAIEDPDCARNRTKHWEPFLRMAEQFGPERTQVFEYYSDSILFKGLAPPHLATLPADLRAYAAAGVGEIQNLTVSDRPWLGPPLHAWLTAKAMWNPGLDVDAALASFCALAFPEAAAEAAAYYLEQDAALRELLALHDLEQGPRHDVLDFFQSPRDTFRKKIAEALGAAARFEAAAAALARAPRCERLDRELQQAHFVAASARHLAARAAALDAALDGRAAEAAAYAAGARRALEEVEAWDEAHNTPAFAVISHGMRRGAHYHQRNVERLLGEASP